MTRRYIQYTLFVLGLLTVTVTAFYFANTVTENAHLQERVRDLGFLGIIATAFFSSLNVIFPVHPATFAPIFFSSGATYFTVVAGYAIGSTVADSLGYVIGRWGRSYSTRKHPHVSARINEFAKKHVHWVLPAAYAYVVFAPLPNELIMIALALAGYHYRQLFLALLIGNCIHHALIVYGYTAVFKWLF